MTLNLNGVMALILRYFTELSCIRRRKTIIRPIPRFQSLLLIVQLWLY